MNGPPFTRPQHLDTDETVFMIPALLFSVPDLDPVPDPDPSIK